MGVRDTEMLDTAVLQRANQPEEIQQAELPRILGRGCQRGITEFIPRFITPPVSASQMSVVNASPHPLRLRPVRIPD